MPRTKTIQPSGQDAQYLCLARRGGGSGQEQGTSWGRRGVSHTWPWSYLRGCQQMSPMLGSQAEVPEAGVCVCVSWWGGANSDT